MEGLWTSRRRHSHRRRRERRATCTEVICRPPESFNLLRCAIPAAGEYVEWRWGPICWSRECQGMLVLSPLSETSREAPLARLTSLNPLHSFDPPIKPPIWCSGGAVEASRAGTMMSRNMLRQSSRVAGAIGGRIATSVRARIPFTGSLNRQNRSYLSFVWLIGSC